MARTSDFDSDNLCSNHSEGAIFNRRRRMEQTTSMTWHKARIKQNTEISAYPYLCCPEMTAFIATRREKEMFVNINDIIVMSFTCPKCGLCYGDIKGIWANDLEGDGYFAIDMLDIDEGEAHAHPTTNPESL